MQKHDPFLKLGLGLVVYRKLLRSLTFLFLILSILTLPVTIIYSYGHGYDKTIFTTSKYEKFSLGNMGFES